MATEKKNELPKELHHLTRTNILIAWEEYVPRSNMQLTGTALMEAEGKLNQCCEVLAVGDEVKTIKAGQFVLMGGTGRLITINGTVYGIIKEHMVDAVFTSRPRLGKDEGQSQGGINTDITLEQLNKFSQKHRYPSK
jgi:hypothetical protein